MELVTKVDEIVDNLVLFDNYKETIKESQHYKFFVDRLKLGRIFVHGINNGEHLFCPSRVVGYVKCTAEKHIKSRNKDGSITTRTIDRLLGEHKKDEFADKKYLELCKRFKIQPSKIGRTYWSINPGETLTKEILRGGELRWFPDETEEHIEGATKQVYVNAYERNPKAREACIKRYGATCTVCGFNFKAKYGGSIGEGFIHIHHLKPIAKQSGEYVVDPTKDLRPVCPNCHAMLHVKDPPLTIEELVEIVNQSAKLTRKPG